MSTLDTPKIHELGLTEPMPCRECDFYGSGDREAVAEQCARDYASLPAWDYIITESTVQPGLWFVWQVKKGGAQ